MKIRNGFVSNSSSSSFVVNPGNWYGGERSNKNQYVSETFDATMLLPPGAVLTFDEWKQAQWHYEMYRHVAKADAKWQEK